MTSTYTSNSGIEKPATGDQSGTWGDTTNTNFDIVDRVLSGVGSITLSGTSHTLTTSDGTLSDGMFKVLVLAGSPTGTNTITISPNDQDKFYLVKNGSGQSAVFSQGTGANVTVPNGGADIIFADGAGSGAAVESLFANAVSFSSISTTGDITSAGTVNVTGDTAAGDDAAIGFTAAEGLILTGQGSTNDVTIKNDADADVIEIPTGTQNVTFAGDITLAGDITTASNADVDINPNGTGNVVLKTDLVSVGGGSEVGHVSSNGAFDMKISSNSGTNSGTIVITDAANGAITLAPNGTGIVDVQGSMNSSISTTGKSIVFGF